MGKNAIILLARELFKIRAGSAGEGDQKDDAVHKIKAKAINFFDQETVEKWYLEAIKTAEIIIALKDRYTNGNN
jgi:uncharacterized glyoxalase superfamily metalloenzyme YdcJ